MTQHNHKPHSRRPADIWAAARADYESGASTVVIGERYDLTARSVRRRAALECWRRDDDPAPAFDILRQRVETELEALPELADVGAVASEDLRHLLLLPDATGLCRYAFRRAAECAVLDGPNEAAAWLRVVCLSERVRARIDADVRPYGPADYLRASMIGSITGSHASESDMSAMSPEIRSPADSDR
jgi:hypothetical protein